MMPHSESLRGIIPPLVLPMTPDEAPDWVSLQRQVAFLLDAGVHGLWVNGTTGEFHALDPAERATAIATVVQTAAKRVPVIAQVGDAATRRAISHIEGAVAAGADYVAAVAPYYLDFSQDELQRYYQALATVSPVPLILYHLPQMTKVRLTVESVLALARSNTIVGIKDSAGDMAWYRELGLVKE